MNEITLEVEKFIAMFIVACGENDGIMFIYYPNLPKNFSEGIDLKGLWGKCDLISIRVNDKFCVELWFEDKDENSISIPWSSMVKFMPMLCASVLTHVYDVVNNLEDNLEDIM